LSGLFYFAQLCIQLFIYTLEHKKPLLKSYLSLVKFSHTIFALPFALLGFFLGVHHLGGDFDWRILVLIVLCMITARSAAMAFNRYLDADIDKLNHRTAEREIPAGVISPMRALIFVIVNAIIFVATTYFINPLCFYLSPIALFVILFYSYTKRFSFLCHMVLGLGLSLAPIGAYIAVQGQFQLIPILYSVAVFFWVSGFDIIYALQDEDFDKSLNLKSIPVWLGKKKALSLSFWLHMMAGIIVVCAGFLLMQEYLSMQILHWFGAAIFIGLLFYQHTLVRPHDLSKINIAFFTTNGYASMVFCSMVILDFYW